MGVFWLVGGQGACYRTIVDGLLLEKVKGKFAGGSISQGRVDE